MSSDGSITHWIHEIQAGNRDAAQALWERYYTKLVRIAEDELRGVPRRMADEEDVALSVLESFCHAAGKGRFPDLADRESLWRLLIRMTARKAVDQRRHESRQRRGGGDAPMDDAALAQVIGDSPSPEFVAIFTEQFRRLLDQLDDEELETLALGKMEGYTNEEMAQRLDCSVRTVERRLHLIRERLKQDSLE